MSVPLNVWVPSIPTPPSMTAEQRRVHVNTAIQYLHEGKTGQEVYEMLLTRVAGITQQQAFDITNTAVSEYNASLAQVAPASAGGPTVEPTQPTEVANGVVARKTFRQLAEESVARGESRVLPIAVGGKNPTIKWKGTPFDLLPESEWQGIVQSWIDDKAGAFPDCNCAVIAKPYERLFIDEDDSAAFRRGYEQWSGESFPKTYTTSARTNRYQSHWLQTDATRKMGNVGQQATFSVRQHNLYVLAEGSQHKNGVDIYRCVIDAPVVAMPDKLVEYILFLRKRDKAPSAVAMDAIVLTGTDEQKLQQFIAAFPDESIPYGMHDVTLISIAGKFRQTFKMNAEQMYPLLVDICERCCAGYGSDYEDMCWKKAQSAARYEIKPQGHELISSAAQAAQPTANQSQLGAVAVETEEPEPEIEDSQIAKRPVFPLWVLAGTSLGEHLVKPATEHSSKYPELIFIPAVQMYLNALALHVKLKDKPRAVPNMFVGVIAPYGQYFKSTCCELGHEYFRYMGLARKHTRDVKNAEGKAIITSVGSTEGLGKAMTAVNAKKCLLYFDELGKVAGKIGIENSSFGEDLLTMYESGDFGNLTKDTKSSFNFEAKTYCFSWQWCTTDRAFARHWAKLANISSGLNDRMFFLLAPERPRESCMYVEPNLIEGSGKTLQLIQKAITQGTYEYESYLYAGSKFRGLDARGLAAAEWFALYFAVDLGEDKISDESVDRARALADYRREVLVFLDPVEAETFQGKIQQEITRELRRNGGKMPYRQLHRDLHGERLGSGVWESAFNGLTGNGTVAYRPAKRGKGAAQRPSMAYLLKQETW
jgi:hypothetical protein